jgi:hypothetical protein
MYPKAELDALHDGIFSVAMVKLAPDLEHGDYLRRRLTSSALLAVSSLLALALSFVKSQDRIMGVCPQFCPALGREVAAQPGEGGLNPHNRFSDYGKRHLCRGQTFG